MFFCLQKLTFHPHLCLQIKQEQANQQKHLQGKEGELSDAKKSLEPLQVFRPSVFPSCSVACLLSRTIMVRSPLLSSFPYVPRHWPSQASVCCHSVLPLLP